MSVSNLHSTLLAVQQLAHQDTEYRKAFSDLQFELDNLGPNRDDIEIPLQIVLERLVSIAVDSTLSNLMTEMERAFRIPALHNEQWEYEHEPVNTLYRTVSDRRVTI